MLVLSHNDRDHTGGAASIVHALPVKRILTSLTEGQLNEIGLTQIAHEFCILDNNSNLTAFTWRYFSR